MDLDLRGRVAMVTGAGTGIGRGIAKLLAEEGAQLVVLGRRRALLERFPRKLKPQAARSP